MRIKSSILNITAGLGNQIVITALSFISRTVFISSLGTEYLGINGLFANILAMLALAEVGIGSSIVYSLYKPVAENDQEKINVLMKLYKNAYMIIALIVFLLGLAVLPFLKFMVKDTSVEHIYLIYLIFLLNTVAPFLYVHKSSFLNVCQKNYIVTGIYSVSSILSVCLKIGILYFTKNYILYLVIDSLLTITNSIVLAIIVNRMYPFLRNKVTAKLDDETKSKIIKNVKAIVLQNIGGYLVFGTDNILISSFVSVVAVGLYSNYKMLMDICRNFINQIFSNTYHSFGNLVAKESKDKVYRIYQASMLLNFWLYSSFSIFLLLLIEPFIVVWLGPDFLLGQSVLIFLILGFYERGMRNTITTIKTTAGIFREDRYAPLVQAVVNLGISIVLVRYWGIAGVFIGTLISALAVPFWYTPYLVYKKVFHKPLYYYFAKYDYFAAVGGAAFFATYASCRFMIPQADDLFKLILKGLVCLIVPNIIYLLLFRKTEEFKYLFGIFKHTVGNIILKLRMNKRERSSQES